jgi:hypothetical protein
LDDYAAQDPINGYDLDGTEVISRDLMLWGATLALVSVFSSECAKNPACNSGSQILVKKLWDSLTRHASKENTPDQDALIQIARHGKKTGGFTEDDFDIIKGWGKELDVPVRGLDRSPLAC